MVEDYEVDLHVFTAKKKLFKSDTKHKTWIYFEDFVNAVHKFVNAVVLFLYSSLKKGRIGLSFIEKLFRAKKISSRKIFDRQKIWAHDDD